MTDTTMTHGQEDVYRGRLISADSHVLEPADLWTTRMDAKWRAKAPRVLPRGRLGDCMVIDGVRIRPLAFEGPMVDLKAKGRDIDRPKGYSHAESRPGGWDPQARLADQDLDGVSGEVIYPGIGLTVYLAPDAEYLYACCRAYNDWLAEFCRAAPDRLKGVAMLPQRGPVEWAVAEAERAVRRGLVGVILPALCDDRPYNLPDWDPLWAAAQDMGIVLSFHAGGRDAAGRAHGPGAGGINMGIAKFEMNETLQHIIWGGAPMRFPRLRWALVESGIGWIAASLAFMDHWWQDHRGWMQPKLDKPPSLFFKQHFYATFEDDRAGIMTRELLGVDNLMWGSDYPHTEGVWPFSRQQVANNFRGIPDDDIEKIICGNATRIYGFLTEAEDELR